tara:strand:- start:25 stop:1458 length:1434 start_codon:yes stop_codon:yes gene_type:complete
MGKIAAIIAVVASVFTAVGVSAAVATIVATVAVGVVAAAGAVAIANKLAKAMTPDMGSAADFAGTGSQGIMVNKTGSAQSIPVIYGETRTGGIRVFAETSGTDNLYLHMAFAIAEGEIDKCTHVYFNGIEAGVLQGDSNGVSDHGNWSINSPWNGKVQIYFRPGTDAQTEISQLGDLKGSWSPHFKGIAYSYIRLEYDEDVWKNGVPEITFAVKGKKVRDPGSLGTVAFSDNPAWCVLDYLTNTRYGKGIADADLDMASFEAAGDYCDTKNFETRGNVTTNGTIYANLIDLLSSCRGYIAFGNKYRMLIDQASSETPFEITDANTIGNVDYVLGDKTTMFNKLTAKYLDSTTGYKDNIKVVSSATLQTADNGLLLEAEIPMPFVKTTSIVTQILTEEINQSRQSHMIQLKCSVDAIDLQVGDLVNVTNETFGITQKTFRVLNTVIEPSSEVLLALREYDANVYGSSIVTNELADNND